MEVLVLAQEELGREEDPVSTVGPEKVSKIEASAFGEREPFHGLPRVEERAWHVYGHAEEKRRAQCEYTDEQRSRGEATSGELRRRDSRAA